MAERTRPGSFRPCIWRWNTSTVTGISCHTTSLTSTSTTRRCLSLSLLVYVSVFFVSVLESVRVIACLRVHCIASINLYCAFHSDHQTEAMSFNCTMCVCIDTLFRVCLSVCLCLSQLSVRLFPSEASCPPYVRHF